MLSIIIPALNAHEYTSECITSIAECTVSEYEIILIDNGSNPTYEYEDFNIKIIRNETNKGFPAAVNQGLAKASGDYICILNNDLLVSPDWDKHFIWHLDHGLDIAGPRSNYVDGPQIILAEIYSNKEEYYLVTKNFYKHNRHKKWAFPRLVGFCLFFKQEVYQKIGGFNEAYGIGNYEDDAWCMKAIDTGFRTGVARDIYLHHFGTITHKLLGLDYNRLLRINKKIFDTEWSVEKIKELNKINEERINAKTKKA